MKKTVSPNRKTGRMIAKNLIVLLVLVAVTFVSMWSWFTTGTKATADGINVQCAASDGIEIAVVETGAAAPASSKYKETLSLSDEDLFRTDGKTQFLHDLSLTEITSDGVYFYRPSLRQETGIASPLFRDDANPDVTWRQATAQAHYISFDLYIRSKSRQNIYIEQTSSFVPNATTLTGIDAQNQSTYGDYSRDCIIGAARFSVVNPTNKSRSLLWIPRPDLYLNTVDDKSDDGKVIGHHFTMSSNITKDEAERDYPDNNPYNHYYYTVKTPGSETAVPVLGRCVIGNSEIPTAGVTTSERVNGRYQLNKNVQIAELTGPKSGDYYYNHVTCNLWIEGEDPESKLALVGGEFTMNLNLSSALK